MEKDIKQSKHWSKQSQSNYRYILKNVDSRTKSLPGIKRDIYGNKRVNSSKAITTLNPHAPIKRVSEDII